MLCVISSTAINNKYKLNKYKKMKDYLIKDKNGKQIVAGQKFKFKFLKELHEPPLEFTGSFCWNQNELRYEIDIWDDELYVCLSYVSNGVMRDFELLP